MRLLAAALLSAALLTPSLAHAGRFALGVSLGRTQAEVDADADLDASSTAGIWGRVNLGKRFGVDLEYGKVSSEEDATRIRSLSLVGRFTIAELRGGTLRPMVLVGLGSDETTYTWDAKDEFTHAELGAAIEFDLARDFVIGLDFRAGDRSREDGDQPLPVDAARQASWLADGSYRSGRLYLGIRL